MNTLFIVWAGDRTIHACFVVSPRSSPKAHIEHLKNDLENTLGDRFSIEPKGNSTTEFEIKKA